MTGTSASASHEVTAYTTLDHYAAVVIDDGQTLSINLPGAPGAEDGEGAFVHNLLGGSGSTLVLNNTDTASGESVVILDNSWYRTGVVDPETAGPDTTMLGNIQGGDGVRIVKSGTGNFTIGGALTADTFEVRSGTATFNGTGNSIQTVELEGGSLVVNGSAAAGTLNMSGGTLTVNGSADIETLAVKRGKSAACR